MQLIFGKDNAEELKTRYTIVELETLSVGDKTLDVYCVIPAEKIAIGEISSIEHTKKLHGEFVQAIKDRDYELCKKLYIHLIGKFGGELDSFYDEVVKRLNNDSNVT